MKITIILLNKLIIKESWNALGKVEFCGTILEMGLEHEGNIEF